MTHLFDSDLIIARGDISHAHHEAALRWCNDHTSFAVCPTTEGALVRYMVRSFPDNPGSAVRALGAIALLPGYEFWNDDVSYQSIRWDRIRGYKQVTDAYLVALAAAHGGRLATFDRALAAVHPEAVLVPLN